MSVADHPVFGPERPRVAYLAISEVAAARAAVADAVWPMDSTHQRLVRALAVRAHYTEYGDTFQQH